MFSDIFVKSKVAKFLGKIDFLGEDNFYMKKQMSPRSLRRSFFQGRDRISFATIGEIRVWVVDFVFCMSELSTELPELYVFYRGKTEKGGGCGRGGQGAGHQ